MNNKEVNSMNKDSLTPELRGEVCPYCKCETELVSDKEIYGPDSN